jgi:hypothetical protein
MSETMNERRHWVIHFSTRMTAIHAALAPTDQRKQPTDSVEKLSLAVIAQS